MLVEIRRQIAETNARLLRSGRVPENGLRRWHDRPDPGPRAGQLIRCRRRRRKQIKRRNPNALPCHLDQSLLVGFKIVPVARLCAMIHELAERISVIGSNSQRVSICRDRLSQMAEFPPGVSKIIERFRKIRPVHQRQFERRARLLRALFRQQCHAEIVVRIGMSRRPLEQPPVEIDRLTVAAELSKDDAGIVDRIGIIGAKPGGLAVGLQRLFESRPAVAALFPDCKTPRHSRLAV